MESVLTCTVPEGEGAHTHAETCYEVQRTLVCEKPEVRLHTHADECYEIIDPEQEYSEENRRLICEQLQVEEHVHTEDGGCLEIVEMTAAGELVENETANEPEIFTTDLDVENEETEAETELDESDTDEKKLYELTKTYEGEGYIVTASYNKDANLPEEAELIADQITAESDAEHYAEREAQFQEMMEGEDTIMNVLLKIGFYVEEDGEKKEIEPETPVEVTVQFLDENGLPEGAPIKVIHFAEEGNEVLNGSDVEEGSTTFEMGSFSEIAIGSGPRKTRINQDGTAYISESYEYKVEPFLITFHVEGEVTISEDSNVEDVRSISERILSEGDIEDVSDGVALSEHTQHTSDEMAA